MERGMHGTQETYKLFLPVWYLIAVAGLYFDVWYHLVIGRDEFWTIPHIFILCGQILHTLYAWILVRDYQKNRRESLHAAYWYLGVQILFFVGLAFDASWHELIGQETIDTALVLWGPPHQIIALPLLLSPFLLDRILGTLPEPNRSALRLMAYGTLFAFVYFHFQPLWPLGAYRVIGAYGELAMLGLLGLALSWSALRLKPVLLPATILSLIFLSMGAIMSWGEASNVPRAHGTFGIPAYPFWITFFSFFIAAVAYDSTRFFRVPFVLRGAMWGGIQGGLYYSAAKLWVDWSPAGIFTMWKFFPGVFLTWDSVISFTLLGAMGGGIGAWMAAHLYKIIADAHEV
jgi:hypothetical protein